MKKNLSVFSLKLSYIPYKFASYNALFKVGMNINEMNFSQLVGISKAEDMEELHVNPR